MSTYTIVGPTKLSGSVTVQGAKNSAMKHVLMPLLAPGVFTLRNIPRITSITNLLHIISLFGPHVNWIDQNTVQIDSTNPLSLSAIPSDLFYHTSGAVFFIPILINHFGECKIEFSKTRDDLGGDQIGRNMDSYDRFLAKIGITKTVTTDHWIYQSTSNQPFIEEVNDNSFGTTVMLLLAALGRSGTSRIIKITNAANFFDTLRILKSMGAQIQEDGPDLLVTGSQPLNGVDFTNMGDQHDFATYVAAALCTQSSISITGYDFDQMKLQPLVDFFDQLGIHDHHLDNKTNTFLVPQISPSNLNPVNIVASDFPHFITEWQVLFSPLFALIPGQSTIIEAWFFDRMRHWLELAKMGAKYQYFTDPNYPEKDSAPRAVKVTGVQKLTGTEVIGKDLRSAACLIIAALCAVGQTTIIDADDHILRGYEKLIPNLVSLGANITVSS